MPTSRLEFLRYPLLLSALRSDKVLIATSFLFICLTVTSRALLLFNHRCGLKLTIGRAAGPGLPTNILTVYWCYDHSIFFLIILKFYQSLWCSWYHNNLRVVTIQLLSNRSLKISELSYKVLRMKTFSLKRKLYSHTFMRAIHARCQRIFHTRAFMCAIGIDTRALNFSQHISLNIFKMLWTLTSMVIV